MLEDEVLLEDVFVLDEVFADDNFLLVDTVLEALSLLNLLEAETLLEEILLEDALLKDVLLEDFLTTDLLLDSIVIVDEVLETELGVGDEDLELDFLIEVDFITEVLGVSKTHLQACLTAGTFRLGIGESCLSLLHTISMTILSCDYPRQTHKELKKEQNDEELLNSLLIRLPDALEHFPLTKLWRCAAFAIAARFLPLVPAGSAEVMHSQAVDKVLASMFGIGEFVLPL